MIDNYEKLQRDNNIPKAAIATISLAMPVIGRAVAPKVAAWAGSSTLANRTIVSGTAGAANAGFQGYNIYKNPETEFSWASFGATLIVGGTSANMGPYSTVALNTAGAGIASVIDGKSPWLPMTGSLIGSSLGYKATEKILPYAEKKFDPWSNGLKEKYHVNMPSITGQASQKSLPPGIISNSAGALSSEGVNKAFNDTAEKIDKEGVIK